PRWWPSEPARIAAPASRQERAPDGTATEVTWPGCAQAGAGISQPVITVAIERRRYHRTTKGALRRLSFCSSMQRITENPPPAPANAATQPRIHAASAPPPLQQARFP